MHTRRYHALLLTATTPPTGRVVLVNDVECWLETTNGRVELSTHEYAPAVMHPDGHHRLAGFSSSPWPTWTYALDDDTRLVHELWVVPGVPRVFLSWRLLGRPLEHARLCVRPLLSGRDHHTLLRERDGTTLAPPHVSARRVVFSWKGKLPRLVTDASGAYRHEPTWYRNFLYREERARGLDHLEDLMSPGVFTFELDAGDAVLTLLADAGHQGHARDDGEGHVKAHHDERENQEASREANADVRAQVGLARTAELARRARYDSALVRAADSYVVRRGAGQTIIAGYPWFTDWGRDTFIALRGLCLCTGRPDAAMQIVREWAGAVSHGMVPNRFAEQGETAEYDSVDAALWFIIAVDAVLAHGTAAARDRERLAQAVQAIIAGYSSGTRHGIRADADGLLMCGAPGMQLTWMDAKVADWVVTPRAGKPVEVQALWLNALAIAARLAPDRGAAARADALLVRGRTSFAARFWNESRGCLYDVVDVDGRSDAFDARLRPNQIYAVGGLPLGLLDGPRARAVVDLLERELWTPLGLRSLARGEPDYAPRYEGGVRARDAAYHQGTVWPYLAGPFIEAWVRVRGETPAAKQEARTRFLAPLLEHAQHGHLPEIADAEAPHAPRGCPFQAWSLAEALRLECDVLAASGPGTGGKRGALIEQSASQQGV